MILKILAKSLLMAILIMIIVSLMPRLIGICDSAAMPPDTASDETRMPAKVSDRSPLVSMAIEVV